MPGLFFPLRTLDPSWIKNSFEEGAGKRLAKRDRCLAALSAPKVVHQEPCEACAKRTCQLLLLFVQSPRRVRNHSHDLLREIVNPVRVANNGCLTAHMDGRKDAHSRTPSPGSGRPSKKFESLQVPKEPFRPQKRGTDRDTSTVSFLTSSFQTGRLLNWRRSPCEPVSSWLRAP